jgi:hypothetical protein
MQKGEYDCYFCAKKLYLLETNNRFYQKNPESTLKQWGLVAPIARLAAKVTPLLQAPIACCAETDASPVRKYPSIHTHE